MVANLSSYNKKVKGQGMCASLTGNFDLEIETLFLLVV